MCSTAFSNLYLELLYLSRQLYLLQAGTYCTYSAKYNEYVSSCRVSSTYFLSTTSVPMSNSNSIITVYLLYSLCPPYLLYPSYLLSVLSIHFLFLGSNLPLSIPLTLLSWLYGPSTLTIQSSKPHTLRILVSPSGLFALSTSHSKRHSHG